MNFVIPMAGRGKRFAEKGFTLPKPLINSHGKTLLQWSIDSLPLNLCKNLICIVLKEHCDVFGLDQFILNTYENSTFEISILKLDTITEGQAQTVDLSKDLWNLSEDLLIFNIDTAFKTNNIEDQLLNKSLDGILACFKSYDSRFSYAKINEFGEVTETAEKNPISNFALNGLYHFKNPYDFLESFKFTYDNKLKIKNEYYVAPLYNYLIGKGKKFRIHQIEENYILGTPEELTFFNPQNC